MDKNEFLEILQQQLDGEIPSNEIYSNLHYYRDYIEKEITQGKTEEEVLNVLGDPRLIAKTLIDADEAPAYQETYDANSSSSEYDYSENRFEKASSMEDSPETDVKKHIHRLDLSTWYGKAILIAIAAVIIFLLVTILSALLPVFLVLVVVGVVISYFRRQ